ncbi:MAG: queuosine salvage family protein [Candidatus ainarchaeum sp.]|nr:queuosine salvage family protein [Candidatus ainarchaeum sp.]
MNQVLESIKIVTTDPKFVTINKENIGEFCNNFKINTIDINSFQTKDFFKNLTDERKFGFILTLASQNACYFGEPKWTVSFNGEEYDGYYAMLLSFERALSEGNDLTNSTFLENLTLEKLKEIFRGNVEVPVLDLRLSGLKEIGKIVNTKYGGKFSNLFDSKDLFVLLNRIIEFSIFNDYSIIDGKKIYFYKKAQLALTDIHRIMFKLDRFNELTAMADYKIPQMLRNLGILIYSSDLANRVDNKIEILHNSLEEIEIRAQAINAVDLIKNELVKKNLSVNSIDIDVSLWLASQDKNIPTKPYHRTRTIFY